MSPEVAAIAAALHRLATSTDPDADRCADALAALVEPLAPTPGQLLAWLEGHGWVRVRASGAWQVMPSTRGPHDSVQDGAGHDACCAAVWWPTWLGSVYITPEEVTGHVARVARAAWGSGNVAPASRSPADASTEHALVSLQARAVRS